MSKFYSYAIHEQGKLSFTVTKYDTDRVLGRLITLHSDLESAKEKAAQLSGNGIHEFFSPNSKDHPKLRATYIDFRGKEVEK